MYPIEHFFTLLHTGGAGALMAPSQVLKIRLELFQLGI
jgi:hypothetical protein